MINKISNFKELRELFVEEYKMLITLIHKMNYYDLIGEDLEYTYLSDRFDGVHEVINELDYKSETLGMENIVSIVSQLDKDKVVILYDWIKSFWKSENKIDKTRPHTGDFSHELGR